MYRYFVKVSYDGSNYSGFQRQLNSNTIQNVIEKAFKNLFKMSIDIFASGRTDKGVHAKGQIFHFDLDFKINEKMIKEGLNRRLPSDIKVLKLEKVNSNMHARYSALKREYEYHIAKRETNPFNQRYEVFIKDFDIEKVKDILFMFEGKKDFAGFSKKDLEKSTIKELYEVSYKETNNHYIFKFSGNSFLRNMVRSIMGLIIEIATGKKTKESIDLVFETKDRKYASAVSKPNGLYLTKVIY